MNLRARIFMILWIAMTCFASTHASAQELLWEKKYPGPDTVPGTSFYARNIPDQLTELPDSTCLYLGWGISQTSPGQFGYEDLKKLDKNGEIIWSRSFFPDTTTYVNPELRFRSFEVLDNGNILLIGKQAMASPYIQLLYTLTLDQQGQTISDTTYYGNVVFTPWCSAKGPGGILVGGYVPADLNQYAYAVKIGNDMTREWEFVLDDEAAGGTYSQFNTIIGNDDGSFDCYGQTRMDPSDPFKFLYVRLDASGQMTRCIMYPDSIYDIQFADACNGPDYRVLLAMYGGSSGLSVETLKIDLEGNVVWRTRYPESQSVYFFPSAIDVTGDDDIVITGQSYYYDSNYMPVSSRIYMLKTDSQGNKLWEADFGAGLTTDSSQWATFIFGNDIVASLDGNYLVAASDYIDPDYGLALSLLRIGDGNTAAPGFPALSGEAVLYPNPITGSSVLALPAGQILQDGELKLFSLTGEPVRVISGIHTGTVSISREGLPAGVYIYTLEDQHKVLYRGKLIVR